MTEPETAPTERDEIEMLLPWYVTGRLDAADRARVDVWLARDKGLARQLAIIEEERQATVLANEAKALPRTLSVESGMRRAVPTASLPQRLLGSVMQGLRGFFRAPEPLAVRWVTAAASVVILAQAVWLGALLIAPEPAGYVTASGGSSASDGGTYALVRFADTASAKDIAGTLAALQMSIADGPRAGGLFRLRIGEKGLSDTERDARLASLRDKPGLTILVTPTQ